MSLPTPTPVRDLIKKIDDLTLLLKTKDAKTNALSDKDRSKYENEIKELKEKLEVESKKKIPSVPDPLDTYSNQTEQNKYLLELQTVKAKYGDNWYNQIPIQDMYKYQDIALLSQKLFTQEELVRMKQRANMEWEKLTKPKYYTNPNFPTVSSDDIDPRILEYYGYSLDKSKK